ncbi:MAG: ABC transporter substrate-binding protein [Prevotella sp.]|nr:ABC transporter substrate-binding protein [Prevotella sp.]
MKYIYILLLTTALAVACNDNQPTAEDGSADNLPADSATFRVAVMPTLDCLPLYVADERGLFEQQGVDVRLVPFMAQMDCDTAFARGRVEAMATDLVRAERLRQKGIKVSYATATDLYWQLLTAKHARIRQLNQLDDKMIAMTRFSATAMLADQLVDSAKLTTERVFRIQVNNVLTRLNMMENGIMDAMLLPEPQATAARLLDSRELYDSRRDSLLMGVLAVREEMLSDTIRKQQLEALLKAYDLACDSLNERGLSAYKDIVVERCKVKAQVADSLPQDLTFRHSAAPRQKDIDKAKAWLKRN